MKQTKWYGHIGHGCVKIPNLKRRFWRSSWTLSSEADKNLITNSGLDISASQKKGSFIAGYAVNKI